MSRVKKGLTKSRRHKKILKAAKGYRGAKNRLVRSAKEALLHAGEYAFSGRKQKKRQARNLWIVRLNAALGETSYSKFINNLKKSKVILDRKILADLAANDPKIFAQIVQKTS
jgi:large subunit ribosomal protein L20